MLYSFVSTIASVPVDQEKFDFNISLECKNQMVNVWNVENERIDSTSILSFPTRLAYPIILRIREAFLKLYFQ